MSAHDATTVTTTEIAKLAGVSVSAVGNWRRRHADFPDPVPTTESKTARYALPEIEEWLESHGRSARQLSAPERINSLLASTPADGPSLFSTAVRGVIVAQRASKRDLARLRTLLDEEPEAAINALAQRSETIPGHTPALWDAAREMPTRSASLLSASLALGVDVQPEAALFHLAADERSKSLQGVLLTLPLRRLALTDGGSLWESRPGKDLIVLSSASRPDSWVASGVYNSLPASAREPLDLRIDRAGIASAATEQALADLADGLLISGRASDRSIDKALRADPDDLTPADIVICSALGSTYPERGLRASDERWFAGVPNKGSLPLAWLQHAISLARPGGLCLVVTPQASSQDAGRSRTIREYLMREGLVEAVIEELLGHAVLWVCRRPGQDHGPPDEVLFATVSLRTESEDPEDIQQIERAAVARDQILQWKGNVLNPTAVITWDQEQRRINDIQPSSDGFALRAKELMEDLTDDVRDLAGIRLLPTNTQRTQRTLKDLVAEGVVEVFDGNYPVNRSKLLFGKRVTTTEKRGSREYLVFQTITEAAEDVDIEWVQGLSSDELAYGNLIARHDVPPDAVQIPEGSVIIRSTGPQGRMEVSRGSGVLAASAVALHSNAEWLPEYLLFRVLQRAAKKQGRTHKAPREWLLGLEVPRLSTHDGWGLQLLLEEFSDAAASAEDLLELLQQRESDLLDVILSGGADFEYSEAT